MDEAWAREALLEQLDALSRYHESQGWQHKQKVAEQMWPRTAAIIQELAPQRLRGWTMGQGGWDFAAQTAINYALGVLEHRAEVAERIGPQGPKLQAASLHPWVWESARPLWGVAHQDAVNAAGRAVNSRLKARLKARTSEVALTNQAFSTEPPKPGLSRLRFPGERNDTWTSRQKGALGLGQACFQGIRNVGNHEETDWTEQVALEYLAAFSVLARWVEECEVEAFEEPVGTADAAPTA